jgi:hypothetical protein
MSKGSGGFKGLQIALPSNRGLGRSLPHQIAKRESQSPRQRSHGCKKAPFVAGLDHGHAVKSRSK